MASRAAGISTASMGKFDKRAAGEKDGERAPMGKRRKLAAVVDSSGKERTSQARAVPQWRRLCILQALDTACTRS